MNIKRFIRQFIKLVFILTIIYLSYLIIIYNYPNKVDSKISGIFIDSNSYSRGTSINKCRLDSINEVNPTLKSTYWFGCSFNNYTSPVFLEVRFPHEIEITSYGSCEVALNINEGHVTSVGEEKCYSFNARVVDGHILQMVYNDSKAPSVSIQISTNIFNVETPEKFVFKSFQIKENPLPFIKSGKFVFQSNNIDYFLKIKRGKFQLVLSESNFIPNIQNEISGDFNYERIFWSSEQMPVEGILYISDIEQSRNKMLINLFGTLFLGILLGIFIDKKSKNF